MKRIWLGIVLVLAGVIPANGTSYDDLNVAISYFNQDQHDNAIAWFDKALAAGDLIPDLRRLAHLDRGIAYAAKGDIQKAITDYSRAIAVQPDETLGYRQRISAYLAIGDYEKAWADGGALRKLRPRDRNLAKEYGWLSWRLDKLESSAEAFGQFSKENIEAWLWLQLANVRLSRPMSATTINISTLTWAGPVVRFVQGDLSEAEVLEGSKDKNAAEVCQAHMYLGMWRVVHGDTVGAAPLLRTASEKCNYPPFSLIIHSELNAIAAGTRAQ